MQVAPASVRSENFPQHLQTVQHYHPGFQPTEETLISFRRVNLLGN